MTNFKKIYQKDLLRYAKRPSLAIRLFLYLFRKAQYSRLIIIDKLFFGLIKRLYGLEIDPSTRIGEGLYINHPYNITINPKVVMGKNINISKGATIGQENRGKRKGTPIIGNDVWIGVNATIVGKIIIGDDVLIAPNSYVNVDVPSHSIVLGNPCIIKPSNYATESYINNRI